MSERVTMDLVCVFECQPSYLTSGAHLARPFQRRYKCKQRKSVRETWHGSATTGMLRPLAVYLRGITFTREVTFWPASMPPMVSRLLEVIKSPRLSIVGFGVFSWMMSHLLVRKLKAKVIAAGSAGLPS